MNKYIICTAILTFSTSITFAGAVPALIPQPVFCEVRTNSFSLSCKTPINFTGDLKEIARLAARELGLSGKVKKAVSKDDAINMTVDPALSSESYKLDIGQFRIDIIGGSSTGVYYAVQTLRQILPASLTEKPVSVPCLTIIDQPRFPWRGLMLDCSRTFQSIDYLKKTIDRLAFYKMNILHLHLTDDQGWRMEIKKHPELTRKGAAFSEKYKEPKSHEGFYTQAELRDLVKYASLRGVTLVPEIEMPGHSHEVLVCRPDLSCTEKVIDEIFPFFKGPTITEDVLCAGNDDTFKLLEEVLDEVIAIFPSQYIHIGGDEAPKKQWKECPKCQARIKTEGLKNEHELQSYFIRRIEKHINDKGRCLIGWSEILQGGLAPNAAVMDWIGGGAQATKTGHDVVMSPTSHCYFDYSYGSISTEKAYSFNPVAGLSAEQVKHILGLQANFWSHIDREPALVDKQLFLRLLALAERAWSPATTTNWPSFSARLNAHLPRLSQMDIHYFGIPPDGSWSPKDITEQYTAYTWDVSKKLTNAGKYRVTFSYTGGACRLGIERVELLADGKVLSSDPHRGVTGASNDANIYSVEAKKFKPGTKYEIRASIRSEGGTDSTGAIYLQASP